MRRVLPVVVLGPVLAGAGFYTALLASVLAAQLLFYAATLGLIGLHFVGLVSSQNNLGAALALVPEWIRSSGMAFYVVGAIGAVAALSVVARAVMSEPEASSWRRAARIGAIAVGVAGLAAGVDWRFSVTPLADRLASHPDFATAQRGVTCSLSVA